MAVANPIERNLTTLEKPNEPYVCEELEEGNVK
jgi:hypothetical protein